MLYTFTSCFPFSFVGSINPFFRCPFLDVLQPFLECTTRKKKQGIWIIKLKEGNYCASYGERSCEDGEKLLLMEANDNHEEEHTVGEFIEFCVNGRTSSTWRVARRPAASLWISVSALVLWKVSSDTTWWEMLWLASFTRSPRREESPQLVELVPSTRTMAQRSHFSRLSPTTS